ncbi:MAG: hypothetical protein HRF40_02320, partial [Nitrososphaera sp.]
MKLEEIFDNISNNMRSDFERARNAIGSNSGVKGDANEGTFRTFLREYLPPSFDIFTGIIVDSLGNQSKQLDIIIADTNKTPIFYKNENVRIVPIESVYAVIEIKAKLDLDELENCQENMKSVKSLKKLSFVIEPSPIEYKVNMYGKLFDIWPVNYYVFAYDSIKLPTLTHVMADTYTVNRTPIEKRIDTICVLDKGVITNQLRNGALSVTGEPPARIVSTITKRALLLFYSLITSNLFHAELPKLDLNQYIKKVNLGDVKKL